MKVDQYGLPDAMVAAIKLSQGGGKQLESAAMQLNLDLVALTTLRAATKLGERALYFRDGSGSMQLQRATNRLESNLDSEVGRLLCVISQGAKESPQEGPSDPMLHPQSPRPAEAASLYEAPRAQLAGPWFHRVSDSGPPPAAHEPHGSAADQVGAELARVPESLHLRASSLTEQLADSENSRISKHLRKLMEARSSPQRTSPRSPPPLRPPPSTTPAASPSKSASSLQGFPVQGSPSRAPSVRQPLTLTGQRRHLCRVSSHEMLAAAATDASAGFQACLPPVSLKQRLPSRATSRSASLEESPVGDGPQPLPHGHSSSSLRHLVLGSQQHPSAMQSHASLMRSVPERSSVDGVGDGPAPGPASQPQWPGPGTARRARRFSLPGLYGMAPEVPAHSLDDTDRVPRLLPLEARSLEQGGSWGALQQSQSRTGRWRA